VDHVGIESIKEAYTQKLVNSGDSSRNIDIYSKEITDPVYSGLTFHPESELSKELINGAISDISVDILGLNKEMSYLADSYALLVNRVQIRLEAVQEKIDAEEDRIRDLNVIGGNYSQFDTVKSISKSDITGTFSYADKTFYGTVKNSRETTLSLFVNDVSGNGLEGNANVKDAVGNTENRSHLVDNDSITQWEYCRYTAKSHQNGAPTRVFVDDEDARCTITFEGEQSFCAIKVQSSADISIEDVRVSTDEGIIYTGSLDHEVYLNRKDAKYSDPAYSYESGIIAFPAAKFMKLQLRSNGITDDVLLKKDGSPVEGAKRHCISIDNIIAFPAQYGDAVFETGELISSPVESVAVFANEYVPPYFPKGTFVQYILTVNGIDQEVVPINSEKAGAKIIRHSDYTVGDNYVKHLNESIKSAKLKVIIKASGDGATPYVSNLKVCFGKGVL